MDLLHLVQKQFPKSVKTTYLGKSATTTLPKNPKVHVFLKTSYLQSEEN